MQHVDAILELGDINHPLLTQHIQPNLVSPWPDVEHRFEIPKASNRTARHELETRYPPCLGGNILHVVEAGTNEA